jgi:cbb3-type cytochrome oxidase cytochrome c subunit
MKSGALVFLAAFIALSASWGGFVLAPQLQLGRAPQENLGIAGYYPLARSGLAKQGAEVYRSLGCVYCHSQQVGQESATAEVVLQELGTNATAISVALKNVNPSEASLAGLPKVVRVMPDVPSALPVAKSLQEAGGKAAIRVVPQGSDISRTWGLRRSVAQDFAHETPVQPGLRRSGPDLANVGLRSPDVNWHLLHLYSPKTMVSNSTMPSYQFLFEKRRVTRAPSPDALKLPAGAAPEPSYEIVPTDAARALAAYLVSLRTEVALDEAPFTPPAPPAPATNAPATTNKTALIPYTTRELAEISK